MKKKVVAFLVFVSLLSSLCFGAVTEVNRQKIYPVDSPVYEAIKYLYIATGLALPSTTGPWSAAELDLMFSRIDKSRLNESSRVTYEYVEKELGAEPRLSPDFNFGLNIGLDTAVEAYYHTNPDYFDEPDDWGGKNDYNVPRPLLSVPLETWIGNLVYGFTSLDVGVNRNLINDVGSFHTNIPFMPPSVLNDLNFNIPYRGFGSIGGSFWNFSIGREKLNWGPGESGNLVIGDQIPYHNNARFTAFTDHFKYTFSLSSFAHPDNYTMEDETTGKTIIKPIPNYRQNDKTGLKMFIAHRLEWRIVNKVNMALTEAIMYQSSSNKFDLMVLSPTVIFHNYYIRANANSILSLDIDYTPINSLNVYASWILDEFTLPGEGGESGITSPAAMGLLGGVKTAIPLGKGMLYGSLEAAYTDPYLYLRENGTDDGYGLNFVVATPEFVGDESKSNYGLNFLGYRYGNDAIVGNLKAGYKVFGSWEAQLEYTYIADGAMDMNSVWQTESVSSPAKTPTSSDSSAGNYDSLSNSSERNAVAHWNIISLSGGITLIKNLDLYGTCTLIHISNAGNVSGEKATDLQFTLGASYHI